MLGQPLILRTLHTALAAGITSFHVVLGYQADAVRALIERSAAAGAPSTSSTTPTGISRTACRCWRRASAFSDRRFALLMGDHLFEAAVLSRLLRTPVRAGESMLAIDARPAPPDVRRRSDQGAADRHRDHAPSART